MYMWFRRRDTLGRSSGTLGRIRTHHSLHNLKDITNSTSSERSGSMGIQRDIIFGASEPSWQLHIYRSQLL